MNRRGFLGAFGALAFWRPKKVEPYVLTVKQCGAEYRIEFDPNMPPMEVVVRDNYFYNAASWNTDAPGLVSNARFRVE